MTTAVAADRNTSKQESTGFSSTGAGDASAVTHYQKATPQEDAAAIDEARKTSEETAKKLKVTFAELQTDHFIVFTDWDKKEFGFLKTNVEGAYTAVSKQFLMSPKDNVFVGKLPIYMFTSHEDFRSFAIQLDKFDASSLVLGYYSGRTDGFGHMAMWKPDSSGNAAKVAAAERQWAYVLTHEFTHAFIARYRTNRPIPRWLNEGMAEVVANGQFPKKDARRFAALMADSSMVHDVFDDEKMPPGEMYPVMMTMVQALLTQGPKTFLNYFNDIKDGMKPDDALQKYYHCDNEGLKATWRKFIKTGK